MSLVTVAMILTPQSDDQASFYGFVFGEVAGRGQLQLAGLIMLVGLAVGVGDPFSRGYLADFSTRRGGRGLR